MKNESIIRSASWRMAERKKLKIVILGAGFGGIRLAMELKKNSRFGVTLIDRKNFHIYYSALYEVASSAPFYSEEELRFSDCLYVKNIFAKSGVRFMEAEVTGADIEGGRVETSEGQVKYDHLVIALGSDVNYYGIEGLKENSEPLKSWEGILRFRRKLREYVDAFCDGKMKGINIVIGGGGFSGTELACELAVAAKREEEMFNIRKKKITVKIVEAGSSLLSGLPPDISQRALKRVRKLGIDVLFSSAVKKVDKDFIYIGRSRLPYDLLIWTGGIAGPGVLRKFPIELNKNGQIVVDEFLRVKGRKNIWAIGDSASFVEHAGASPIPAQGYFAIQEAIHTAVNLRRHLMREPPIPFNPVKKGFIIPLGGKYGLAYLWEKIIIEGFAGWVLRKIVDLNYFLSVVGRFRALNVWWRQIVIFSKND